MQGATISFNGHLRQGIFTNAYGFHSINLPEGHYSLVSTHTSFKPDNVQIELHKNLLLNIQIHSSKSLLKEVILTAHNGRNSNILTIHAGVQRISIKPIQNIPCLLKETDILKTILLLLFYYPIYLNIKN